MRLLPSGRWGVKMFKNSIILKSLFGGDHYAAPLRRPKWLSRGLWTGVWPTIKGWQWPAWCRCGSDSLTREDWKRKALGPVAPGTGGVLGYWPWTGEISLRWRWITAIHWDHSLEFSKPEHSAQCDWRHGEGCGTQPSALAVHATDASGTLLLPSPFWFFLVFFLNHHCLELMYLGLTWHRRGRGDRNPPTTQMAWVAPGVPVWPGHLCMSADAPWERTGLGGSGAAARVALLWLPLHYRPPEEVVQPALDTSRTRAHTVRSWYCLKPSAVHICSWERNPSSAYQDICIIYKNWAVRSRWTGHMLSTRWHSGMWRVDGFSPLPTVDTLLGGTWEESFVRPQKPWHFGT